MLCWHSDDNIWVLYVCRTSSWRVKVNLLFEAVWPSLGLFPEFGLPSRPDLWCGVTALTSHFNTLVRCLSGSSCNTGYLPEIHFKLKFCSSISIISLTQSFCHFALSMAVSLPCSVQNYRMIGQWQKNKDIQDFMRFEFKMSFAEISYIVTAPGCLKSFTVFNTVYQEQT